MEWRVTHDGILHFSPQRIPILDSDLTSPWLGDQYVGDPNAHGLAWVARAVASCVGYAGCAARRVPVVQEAKWGALS
jgi:hypothetical protein